MKLTELRGVEAHARPLPLYYAILETQYGHTLVPTLGGDWACRDCPAKAWQIEREILLGREPWCGPAPLPTRSSGPTVAPTALELWTRRCAP